MAAALQPAAIPTSNPDSAAQLSALLTGVAIAPLDSTASSASPAQTLPAGSTAWSPTTSRRSSPARADYNFVLNAQGRIQGDSQFIAIPAAAARLPARNRCRATRRHPRPPRPLHHHGRCRASTGAEQSFRLAHPWPKAPSILQRPLSQFSLEETATPCSPCDSRLTRMLPNRLQLP